MSMPRTPSGKRQHDQVGIWRRGLEKGTPVAIDCVWVGFLLFLQPQDMAVAEGKEGGHARHPGKDSC